MILKRAIGYLLLALWPALFLGSLYFDKCGGSIWQDVVCKSPHNSRAHVYLGQQYYALGRFDLAEREWAIALETSPTDPHPYAGEQTILAQTGLADIMTRQGRWREAYTTLRNVLKLAPNYLPAWTLMSFIYTAGGNPQEGLRIADFLLGRDDRLQWMPELWYARGIAFHAMKQCGEANQNYRRAKELNPKLQIEMCKGS